MSIELDRYMKLLHELYHIRQLNNDEDSIEEEKLLENMDSAWWCLSEKERTEMQKEDQRRSFVYGNTSLSNPDITKELVDKVADNMKKMSWWQIILDDLYRLGERIF